MKKILIILIMTITVIAAFGLGVNYNKGIEVKEIVTESREDFYLENGEMGVIFSNNDWIVVSNYQINE